MKKTVLAILFLAAPVFLLPFLSSADQTTGGDLSFSVQPISVTSINSKVMVTLGITIYKEELKKFCNDPNLSKYSYGVWENITRTGFFDIGEDELRKNQSFSLPNEGVFKTVIPVEVGFATWRTHTDRVLYATLYCGEGSIKARTSTIVRSDPVTVRIIGDSDFTFGCVNGGVFDCDSKGDANCSNMSGRCPGTRCQKISPKSLCGNPATTSEAFGCIADGKYVCSPSKSTTCSDVPSCAGKACIPVNPASLCLNNTNPVPAPGASVSAPGPISYSYKNYLVGGPTSFGELVGIVARFIFNLAIPIAVIIIIYGGFRMLTSGGNPSNYQKGLAALKYATLGLVVLIIAKGFVSLIQSILSLQ